MDSKSIIDAVQGVTAKWAKQRKAEERHASAEQRRREAMTCRYRSVTLKDAAWAAIPDAYMKASANNALPAKARQVMYAARGKIQALTGKSLDDRYFTQTLLPDYIAEHPELTARLESRVRRARPSGRAAYSAQCPTRHLGGGKLPAAG